jgi:hypothetical protein
MVHNKKTKRKSIVHNNNDDDFHSYDITSFSFIRLLKQCFHLLKGRQTHAIGVFSIIVLGMLYKIVYTSTKINKYLPHIDGCSYPSPNISLLQRY